MTDEFEFPERLPVGPFARWLEEYAPDGINPIVAEELGIGERSLRRFVTGEFRSVAFDSVDTALQRASKYIEVDGLPIFWVGDLYPNEVQKTLREAA